VIDFTSTRSIDSTLSITTVSSAFRSIFEGSHIPSLPIHIADTTAAKCTLAWIYRFGLYRVADNQTDTSRQRLERGKRQRDPSRLPASSAFRDGD
jgi:hypothetical protein